MKNVNEITKIEETKTITKDLTRGSVLSVLLKFSLPFLLSSFLQTFYGLADLFITGQFYGSSTISSVSIGSQLMHMITVIIVGLAMGTTVCISRAVGLKDNKSVSSNIGNTVTFFSLFSILLTALLILLVNPILKAISTPIEAFNETRNYCVICFIGVPFITSYNILSSIYRGLGDSKSPMIFIAIAGVINIVLDYIFIGLLHMGSSGAALATIIAQALSVVIALVILKKKNNSLSLTKKDLKLKKEVLFPILKIGFPVSLQDGFIQISFLVITAIANSRGVVVAASVGIVEKIICFLFLVPSAMLSSVSAIAAQNNGAKKDNRSFKTLLYACVITVVFGTVVTVICNIVPYPIMKLFTDEKEVIALGAGYLCAYVTDCIVAGIHFCCSGFFCAYGKSIYSFIHNILSILLIRIPGAYLASVYYPNTLVPMGFAAPLGSLFSAILCIFLFFSLKKKIVNNAL